MSSWNNVSAKTDVVVESEMMEKNVWSKDTHKLSNGKSEKGLPDDVEPPIALEDAISPRVGEGPP